MSVTTFYGQNQKISNDQVKVAAKKIKASFISCELLVNRVVTFGMVLHHNQRPLNFILYFTELQIIFEIQK